MKTYKVTYNHVDKRVAYVLAPSAGAALKKVEAQNENGAPLHNFTSQSEGQSFNHALAAEMVAESPAFPAMSDTERAARNSDTCPACGQEKMKGCAVCWGCFKEGSDPWKYSGLPFDAWMEKHKGTQMFQK